MTVSYVAEKLNFKIENLAQDSEISCIFCGDLLSWAMGRAQEGAAWCTVMGNVNAVAVAHLTEAACLVLCHSSPIAEDALAKAKEQGINILSTSLPEFEASYAIAKLINI